jgi:hypothetical protein
LLLKDSPNFIGVAKGEDKLRLKVNEIIADGKKSGDIDKMAMKWLGRPQATCRTNPPAAHDDRTRLRRRPVPVALAGEGRGVDGGADGHLGRDRCGRGHRLRLGAHGATWLKWVAGTYVELIRNTPFIVQLFFIFFGLPAAGVKLSPEAASIIAMVINLGAYAAEIIRAGIEATPRGQIEAA